MNRPINNTIQPDSPVLEHQMTLCLLYYTRTGEEMPTDVANLGLEWTKLLMPNPAKQYTDLFCYLNPHLRSPVYKEVFRNFEEGICIQLIVYIYPVFFFIGASATKSWVNSRFFRYGLP